MKNKEEVLSLLVDWLKPISRSDTTIMCVDGDNMTGHKALIATIVLSGLVVDYLRACSRVCIDVDYINSTRFGRHLEVLGFKIPAKEIRLALLGV